MCRCLSAVCIAGAEGPTQLRGLRELPALLGHLQPGGDIACGAGAARAALSGVSIKVQLNSSSIAMQEDFDYKVV